MTVIAENSSIVADLISGGQQNDVSMMIGVGIKKESDAVYFMYQGDEQEPVALTIPTNGKPLTRFANVRVVDIDIAEGIGEFNSTKLNLYLSTSSNNVVMVTSGLTTIWSQCLITGLMGAFDQDLIQSPMTLDSWKGNSKMKPCFAAIRINGIKVSDQDLYDQLRDARSDRDNNKVISVMKDSISILKHAVSQSSIKEAKVDLIDSITALNTTTTTTNQGDF